MFFSLVDRLVGVIVRFIDRLRLVGDWGFFLVGVLVLDFVGEVVLVRAGDCVFFFVEGGDFRIFLFRFRERFFDRFLDEDLDVDFLFCEIRFNKGFILIDFC